MPKIDRVARDRIKRRVLLACRDLLARGLRPSERRLRDAVTNPSHGVDLLIRLRYELIAEGTLDWAPGRPAPGEPPRKTAEGVEGGRGLGGGPKVSQEEMDLIKANRLAVLAEKLRHGIPPSPPADPEDRARRVRIMKLLLPAGGEGS